MQIILPKHSDFQRTDKNIKIALVSLTDKNDQTPPMGLASIATYIRHKLGIKNIKIFENCYDNLLVSIENFKPDIIGISAMTVDYQKAINLATNLKKSIHSPIIIGGVHISTLPLSFKNCFDIGVIGEGESTFFELIELYLKENRFESVELKKIKGLVFIENNNLILTKKKDFIDLKKVLIPDRSFLNLKHYRKMRLFKFREYGIGDIIMASRGCSYRCLYCSSAAFWKRRRNIPIDKIIKEIRYIIDAYRVNHITLWDDLFASDKEYLTRFKEEIHKYNINKKVKFSCHLRADLVDKEICTILKEIGVTSVDLGFESGSSRVLRFLKKSGSSLQKNKEALELCKKEGFFVIGNLLFGSPNETLNDMKKTLNFLDYALKNKIDRLSCFVLVPLPGTWMWDFAKKEEKVADNMDWTLLSFQNIKNPLLLNKSVSNQEFRDIFLSAKRMTQYQKLKDVRAYFKSDPLNFLIDLGKNPFYYIKKFLLLVEDYGTGK